MQRSILSGLLARFGLGLIGGLAAGYLAFRARIFDPAHPAFHCISVGVLATGIFALVRSSRPGLAGLVVLGYSLLQLGLADADGWGVVAAGALLAAGIFLIALIFDLLARGGLPFGKFLIVGPLLGGVYLAVIPLMEFHALTTTDAVRTLLSYIFLGVVIGDGVGLGVELGDIAVSLVGADE